MKNRKRSSFLMVAAVVGLGLGACDEPDSGNGQVKVLMRGLSSVDNAVDVVLDAGVDGTQYFFELSGLSGPTYTTLVLNIYYGDSASGPLVYTLEFSLPNEAVNTQVVGESGYGSTVAVIYDGTNTVVIRFAWDNYPAIIGDTQVDIEFSRAPRIIVWSMVPGPGSVVHGDVIAVQAEVAFYGDGTSEEVAAVFYSSGSPTGAPGALSDPESDGIWNGLVTAVSGADSIRITATDNEGTAISNGASYPIP